MAATYGGTDMVLYVNGDKVGSRPAAMAPSISAAPFLIGGDGDRFVPCTVAAAALYNHALSAEEVGERYKTLSG